MYHLCHRGHFQLVRTTFCRVRRTQVDHVCLGHYLHVGCFFIFVFLFLISYFRQFVHCQLYSYDWLVALRGISHRGHRRSTYLDCSRELFNSLLGQREHVTQQWHILGSSSMQSSMGQFVCVSLFQERHNRWLNSSSNIYCPSHCWFDRCRCFCITNSTDQTNRWRLVCFRRSRLFRGNCSICSQFFK